MGYGLMTCGVPAFQLDGICERNEYRLEKSLEKAGPRLAELDREQAAIAEPDAEILTHEQAVREIYAGAYSRDDEEASGTYSAAFEVLCMTWAGCRWEENISGPLELHNDRFYPIRMTFLEELDHILESEAIDLSFLSLCLTPPEWFPMWKSHDVSDRFGHWTVDQLQRAESPLRDALPRIGDSNHRAAMEQALDWLGIVGEYDRMSSLSGRRKSGRTTIIGFYH